MPQPIDALETIPEPIEGLTIEEVFDQHPTVEVIHDTDVLVRPQTADSVDSALRQGGDVTIIRRWTRETLEGMMERGDVRRRPGQELLAISTREDASFWERSEKELIDAAGVRQTQGGLKIFQVYETWQLEDCDGEQRLTKSYYGGYDLLLSCRRNPMWNDRCQLISAPVNKQTGVFKGISSIKPGVASLQYYANQIAQQAADSATYSMLPIVMTDPAKNPQTSTMLLNVGAVWKIDPQSTQFAQFPPIWKDGILLINDLSAQIMNAMGVNPSMIPQSSQTGRRQNQAEIAREQQVDIMSGLEEAAVMEDDVLSPTVTYWAEYDHQFRDEEATVKTYGPAGQAAIIETVPLLQSTTRFHFSWYGVEQVRNAAVQQQLTALLNVAMSPTMTQALAKNGKQIDPTSALETAFGRLIGWRESRKLMVDIGAKTAYDPELENRMLIEHFDVPVNPADDDQKHSQVHSPLLQHPDPVVRMWAQIHLQRHAIQQGMKTMAAAGQMGMGQPQPQQPQGPVPGGTAMGPRPNGRQPPGAIPTDQMPRAGAVPMPRRM
jgi:hypothetical protein